ncbi:gephyrin-like molybdotransferase Glp [Pseudoruegeria sp. SK021]|uniref:molybdopterin molybdotransferase MoeA n=1 Tax=Pseudoruegeria sp. SK021 TaxID=1933035 RepID=UPI000A251CD0|nr:gephyrin-like molybdotransferase Glp [Pseudoruegeria sp. SK021]OSP56263.1 molybdopterin molybdenumtransferase MoeA [Pseudoruegeria sp. SK021]
MIPVSEALDRIFALLQPLAAEPVALRNACGRVLAEDAVATRDQPPFAASAMDGYAVASDRIAPGARFTVIGEAAAGQRYPGQLFSGQAVRIFTGAPVPAGADRIVIQEDVTVDGNDIILSENLDAGTHIRPAGGDFRAGARLPAGTRLSPADVALLAAMNIPSVRVHRRPIVGLLTTGDELVMPGTSPSEDQILSSNGYGLAALLEREGALVRLLPIARDRIGALQTVLALTAGCDLVVTTGGASVGDHDLIGNMAADLGLSRSFYTVAMRPGKPMMAGILAGIPLIGLPGNPVSSMVCGTIFILPSLRVLMGLPAQPAPRSTARLAVALTANGPREHYMRAWLEAGEVTVFDRQDSSLQSVLSRSNALVVRPPNAPMMDAGATVDVVLL